MTPVAKPLVSFGETWLSLSPFSSPSMPKTKWRRLTAFEARLAGALGHEGLGGQRPELAPQASGIARNGLGNGAAGWRLRATKAEVARELHPVSKSPG